MITKFDSLFAGHVDMSNVGYGGTAVNDRRFSNEHLIRVFDKAQSMAQLMDRLDIHDVAGLVRFAIRVGLIAAGA